MKWFRSNIKNGSRLALLALAIQLVLSFGHFHATSAQAAPSIQTSIAQAELALANSLLSQDPGVEPGAQSNHQREQLPADACAICAVMALANAALFATPPLLPLPKAAEFLYLTTETEFVHLNSARVAFQPRAPPAS